MASDFAHYLHGLTGVETVPPATLTTDDDTAALLQAVERLDHALTQLIDLASVYGDDPRLMTEPLVNPVAALLGAYLTSSGQAQWLPPDTTHAYPGAPLDSLAIATTRGIALDLFGVTRAALFSSVPNLHAAVEHLLSMQAPGAEATDNPA